MMQKPVYIDEFNYTLPDERIAKFPLAQRDCSKLLIYKDGKISEDNFYNITEFLPDNSLLVCNNTRVICARLHFEKSTGAKIEVFCLEPKNPVDYSLSLSATNGCEWKCMIGNLKKWKNEILSQTLTIKGFTFEFTAEKTDSDNDIHSVYFRWNCAEISFAEILENVGELPIPPYLKRKTETSDKTTYQTVYSKIDGSVAAPTAGLHFTKDVFTSLKSKNIEIEELTLHVGAGTFLPVKTDDANEHRMHAETIEVRKSTIEHILKKLGNIVAVGTTSVRTLESLYYIGASSSLKENQNDFLHIEQFEPYKNNSDISAKQSLQNILNYLNDNKLDSIRAETQIMIRPGYKFKIVDAMITNFHQPRSTLLLLISTFVSGNWQQIYNYALEHDFRFLSYGDSSLLFKN
jgi:S-adenosylmethionine:tRNA-ribosyltransferase-isomerase (queuine synthetase)